MKANIVPLYKSICLRRAIQKIARLYVVLFKQSAQSWVTGVSYAVDVDQKASKIEFALIRYNVRSARKCAVSMLNRGEAVIYITHIPVEVFHAAMAADVLKKSIEHLPL